MLGNYLPIRNQNRVSFLEIMIASRLSRDAMASLLWFEFIAIGDCHLDPISKIGHVISLLNMFATRQLMSEKFPIIM